MRKIPIILPLFLASWCAFAQEGSGPMSLKQCLDYSLENNAALQKDRIGVEIANQSRREILGSLLPQLGASSQFTYNIQKTRFAMPNFINEMMPEPLRDPDAPKYMTVTMGMDLSANWGVALTQQIVNFSLFNAVGIANAAEEMAQMGRMADVDDVISKTATLFYNAQILEYSLGLFDESLAVMERTSGLMEANRELGIVRTVDADRIAVARTNLETEKQSLRQALEVQKNLLKLEMGFPMDQAIDIAPVDIDRIESMIFLECMPRFNVEEQLPFRIFRQQKEMLALQRKAAVAEVLPVLVFNANYSTNYMGDHFYGETYNHFPVSMLSVSLKFPIFTGMSKTAKVKKAGLELQKAEYDERMLVQSLTMGYNNARMQMDQNRSTICSQKRNKDLAQDVLRVTEANYNEGLANLSDVLNASSSLIQAQMNYINALSNSVKSYIDLKKADGTISEINK
ncbi:MAG: TolC family protein [Bacteroidales bacterium]|nr:TolC family protein [Candidatus Cryptobacteroides choladohippi]